MSLQNENVDLHIEPNEQGKGRTFSASLLAAVEADSLWDGGKSDSNVRPVFLMYGASVGNTRPFTANLRLGRKATIGVNRSYSRRKNPSLELLKSKPYSFSTQTFREGTVTTVYLPQLLHVDPGMVDPTGIRFVTLPRLDDPVEGLDEFPPPKDKYDEPTKDEVISLARAAPFFALMLDRRTRAPIIPDPKFHRKLLFACVDEKLAFLSSSGYGYGRWGRSTGLGFVEMGTESIGLAPGVAMMASHEAFETLLGDVISDYYKDQSWQD